MAKRSEPPKKTTSKAASRPEEGGASTKSAKKASAEKNEAAASGAVAPDDSQLPAKTGKVTVFGGPKDRGYKADDKLALPTGKHFTYERVMSLNPKSFYCAMRWTYRLGHMSPEEGKRWWANKKILITNPKTGAAVIARAVDYGPHEATGLDVGISPGAAEAIGIESGDEVQVAFADQKAQLGPVSS
jgi:hypothetical protein